MRTGEKPSLFDSIRGAGTVRSRDGVPDIHGMPCDVIEQHGHPYMERFYLLGQKMAGGSSMRYHHIVASDDEVMHDHPWDFVSIILSGSYLETTSAGEEQYGTGTVLVRPAEQLHRLTLVDGPVWTMVVLGPPRRRWGYQTPTGWQHWSDYQSVTQ